MGKQQSAVKKKAADSVVDLGGKRRANEQADERRFLTTDERREAVAFILVAIGVVLFLALILNPAELRGITTSEAPSAAGKFGKWLATQVGIVFGFGGLIVPPAMALWGLAVFQSRPRRAIFAKTLAFGLCLISTCALFGLFNPDGYWGGSLGDRISNDLYRGFGVISYVILFFSIIVSIVIGTPLSFSALAAVALQGMSMVWNGALRIRERIQEHRSPSPPVAVEARRSREKVKESKPATNDDDEDEEISEGDIRTREYFEKAKTRVVSTPALQLLNGEKTPAPSAPLEAPGVNGGVKESPVSRAEKQAAREVPYTPMEDFTLPSISLLNSPTPGVTITEEDLKAKAQSLQEMLSDFGVESKVGDIVPGPTVTRFEIVPAPGVKVSSITQRADDIALAMAAPSIRIEAPIPGKSAVGVEIPNRKPQIVTLKEVIASEAFQELRKQSPLAVALGQDISGAPIAANLRSMPHLLIAGSTGSGKSVCINSIVNSLILSAKPTEVKMLMIDPKVVELQEYDDIPHLLAPVVTDVRKAPRALMWAVEEMERRYRMLANAGVREIEEYNALIEEKGIPEKETRVDDFIDLVDELPSADRFPEGKLPFIVVIVDEFGDLMMVAAKECEEAIIRIAQKARAVGIHLIIATQRPSVDVITGIIKANLPSRIAFLVSSRVDSRTILDVMGAERLLGRGDMLFKAGDKPKSVRLQGCFISGPEIKKIIKHYSDQGHGERIVRLEESLEAISSGNQLAEHDDPLLGEALRIVLEDGHASVSRLQRRLSVGHPRASRLVDIMEARGLVTPSDGSKPRQLLFTAEDLPNLVS